MTVFLCNKMSLLESQTHRNSVEGWRPGAGGGGEKSVGPRAQTLSPKMSVFSGAEVQGGDCRSPSCLVGCAEGLVCITCTVTTEVSGVSTNLVTVTIAWHAQISPWCTLNIYNFICQCPSVKLGGGRGISRALSLVGSSRTRLVRSGKKGHPCGLLVGGKGLHLLLLSSILAPGLACRCLFKRESPPIPICPSVFIRNKY